MLPTRLYTHIYDYPQLHDFIQSFVVDGQVENISGHSYTLAGLKNNIDAKLFGQALEVAEEQYVGVSI